jgi:hypothetical protein
MPSVWMMSFDWNGLNEVLAPPAAELAGRLARLEEDESGLPQDESELKRFLQTLLASEDWYAGKSPREARAVDAIIDDLFHHEPPPKRLNLKPLSDGVTWDILQIAKGAREPDDASNTAGSRQIYIKKVESPPEADLVELLDLGSRPFRHPAWNRRAVDDPQNNPFIHGGENVYTYDYSIHSPEQVLTLRQELARVGDRVRRQLDRIPTKRIREDALANFQDDLVGAIEQAAKSRRAVYARWDY